MGVVKKFRKRQRPDVDEKAEGLFKEIKTKVVSFVNELAIGYADVGEEADAAAMVVFLDESVQFLLNATDDADGTRRQKFLAICAARYDEAEAREN